MLPDVPWSKGLIRGEFSPHGPLLACLIFHPWCTLNHHDNHDNHDPSCLTRRLGGPESSGWPFQGQATKGKSSESMVLEILYTYT